MSNRRNYGSGYGGGFNQNNARNSYGLGSGSIGGVSPWQAGNTPGRGGSGGVPQSLLSSSNLLNSLSTPDAQLALATKLLTSILPVQQSVQQPPSLLSLNSSFGGSGNRFGSGYGNDRFRRDDRRNDNFRNRRQTNNKDKGADNKSRGDSKGKTKSKDEKNKSKSEDESEEKEGDREDDGEKKDGEEGETKKDDKKEEGPIPGYENIPQNLFHCHVCNKNMWNDVSYDTHIKGRNHRLKLRDLEDDYQVQTDLMRQMAAMSLKLDELRKGGKRRPYPDQYCKMCDLHFNGMSMLSHRSTNEHQSLKRFIHPTCDICKKDFQVRIEYDEHLLCAAHLQNQAKIQLRKEKYEKDPNVIELKENEARCTTVSEEASDVGEKGDIVLNEEDEKLIKTILDDKTAVPEYDPDAEALVARDNVVAASGFFCKLCKIFLLKESVVDTHCRTMKHFNKYVTVLKAEATKKNKEEESSEADKRKSDATEDSDGNWKRRKLDVKKEVNGGGKYDPEETIDETMEDNVSEASGDKANIKEEDPGADTTESHDEEDKPKRGGTPRRGRQRVRK